MADVSVLIEGDDCTDMPPGFRFHPTDEEIITHYLVEKAVNQSFSARAIGEVDLNKSEPWDLPSKAKMGEKEWYFFVQRDRKYPTGMRTNRATEAGYWKATGKDKEIYKGRGCLVGMKKTLVFYLGRAPKGEKTNWVMHEYRLEGKSTHHNIPRTAKDEWAVCRVFHKNTGIKRSPMPGFGDDLLDSSTLPPLMDPPNFNSNRPSSSSFLNDNQGSDFKGIIPSSTTTTPMPSYFTMMGMEDPKSSLPNFYSNINHQMNQSNPAATNSIFYPQIPHPNPYFMNPGSANLGYLHQEQAILRALTATHDTSSALRRHAKLEQFSNQSMVTASQDTGLSTEGNTEISSVMSKHEMGSCQPYDDLNDPSCEGPMLDLENMWKY